MTHTIFLHHKTHWKEIVFITALLEYCCLLLPNFFIAKGDVTEVFVSGRHRMFLVICCCIIHYVTVIYLSDNPCMFSFFYCMYVLFILHCSCSLGSNREYKQWRTLQATKLLWENNISEWSWNISYAWKHFSWRDFTTLVHMSCLYLSTAWYI